MKKICFILFFTLSLSFLSAKTLNKTQYIESGHWIYEELKIIQTDSKNIFTQNSPVSAAEIEFYLKKIDYENLSSHAKISYDRITSFLNCGLSYSKDNAFRFYLGLDTNPELYYKSNPVFDWSYRYILQDNLMNMPVLFGINDIFTIEADFFLGKNYISMHKDNNFSNLPLNTDDLEFNFPRFCYGSTGYFTDNYGISFYAGKSGKTIGHTLTGSVIYNQTFETDFYAEFSFFTKPFKYTLDVIEISNNRMDTLQTVTSRYLYLHQIEFKPFKNFYLSFIEGSLIAQSFQLRFINPFVTMHQFGGWLDYPDTNVSDIYKESNFAAYFAFEAEYIPVKNLRFYALFSQNEMQIWYERKNAYGNSYPDSIGLQIGSEYFLSLNIENRLTFGLEGLYTSPYLYIKQTPSSSLFRQRLDMQTKKYIYSWIGSPYGPDTIGCQVKANYQYKDKLALEFDYIFNARGEHSFNLFSKTKDGYYIYYPSVRYKLAQKGLAEYSQSDIDEIYKEANDMSLSGSVSYLNQFFLKTSYNFSSKMSLYGQLLYSFLISKKYQKIQHGFECGISFKYKFI